MDPITQDSGWVHEYGDHHTRSVVRGLELVPGVAQLQWCWLWDDSSMLHPTTRVLDLGETMCCVSHHHEISRMRGRGGWSPSPTMSRHLQDVMPPMGWRTGPHSSVLEYGTRAGAHAYVRSTYHHGYVAHHHPEEYISRWIHGSMMWSTG